MGTDGPLYPEVTVQLTGQDGNAMFIMGRVTGALRDFGVPPDVRDEYAKQAMAGSYHDLLRTTAEWVNVR